MSEHSQAEAPYVAVVGDVMTDVVVRGLPTTRAGGTTRDPDLLTIALEEGSDTAARIQLLPGGSAANTAAWLGWSGCPVVLLARVGADAASWHRAALAQWGVRAEFTVDSATSTGATVAVVAENGERSFVTDAGANSGALEPASLHTVRAARWLHMSAYALMRPLTTGSGGVSATDLWRGADAAGVARSVDLSSTAPLRAFGSERLVQLLGGVAVVFATAPEAATALGRPSDRRVAPDELAADLVLKLGRDGVLVRAPTGRWRIPAVEVSAQDAAGGDSVGVGDAFAAAYLAARMAGDSNPSCAQRAVEVGALARRIRGGRPVAAPEAR